MSLTVILGGARSGKSSLALRLALDSGAPVTFVATGEPRDEEMAARIDVHRRERPGSWTTVEEPVELGRAVGSVRAGETVVIDCLTLWVANALERGVDVEREAAAVASAAAERTGETIVVTNEVGLGIVPVNDLARAFRDTLGRVNMTWVAASQRAVLCVAGRTVEL